MFLKFEFWVIWVCCCAVHRNHSQMQFGKKKLLIKAFPTWHQRYVAFEGALIKTQFKSSTTQSHTLKSNKMKWVMKNVQHTGGHKPNFVARVHVYTHANVLVFFFRKMCHLYIFDSLNRESKLWTRKTHPTQSHIKKKHQQQQQCGWRGCCKRTVSLMIEMHILKANNGRYKGKRRK